MVSGSLALLYFLLGFHGGRQGSGPVELEDFPFVCSSIRPSIRSPLWAIQPGLRPSQPGLRPSQPSLKPETLRLVENGFFKVFKYLHPTICYQ